MKAKWEGFWYTVDGLRRGWVAPREERFCAHIVGEPYGAGPLERNIYYTEAAARKAVEDYVTEHGHAKEANS